MRVIIMYVPKMLMSVMNQMLENYHGITEDVYGDLAKNKDIAVL